MKETRFNEGAKVKVKPKYDRFNPLYSDLIGKVVKVNKREIFVQFDYYPLLIVSFRPRCLDVVTEEDKGEISND